MPLSSQAFNPSTLIQEQPSEGQTLGIDGLDKNRVPRPTLWKETNANVKARKGVIDGFVKTCERWRLGQSDQIILLGYSGNELAGLPVLTGRVRPSQDVLDRTGYVLNISIGLSALFNNSISNEVDWLLNDHPNLNATPMRTMLSGRMADMVRVVELVSRERAL